MEAGIAHCPDCSRELAAEQARSELPPDADREIIEYATGLARIEFELYRDPDRTDAELARLCRTSMLAVSNARRRLRLRRDVQPSGGGR